MPEVVQAPPPRLASTPATPRKQARSWRLSREGIVLVALAAWSLVPLALLFVSVGGGLRLGTGGRFFTGADGPDIIDQLQYMSWIRDAADHGLFSNRFQLGPHPDLFLHPLFVLSGFAWKLGASIQLSFLAWKPVAVVVLFAGFAAYVRRMVEPGRWARPAALVLALFFFTPAAWLVDWAGLQGANPDFHLFVMAVDLFPGAYVWGLWSMAIAVGLMPVFLLCFERAVDPAQRRPGRSPGWYAGWAAVAGLVTSWIHPWQGLTLLVIAGVLIAWGRLWRRGMLVIPVAATLAPLAYYFALSHTHAASAVASRAGAFPHLGGWFFLALVPPLLLAATGLPGQARDLQERAVRLWPLAALIVYFALDRSWFYHALAGLSLPLAILGVRGWRKLRVPKPVAAAAVAILTLPGMAYYVQELRKNSAGHFLARGEAAALRATERSPRPGGILTAADLGQAVPAFSGRSTWVGHIIWTPRYFDRAARAQLLFEGRLPSQDARALVRSTGATFLLAGCGKPDLRPTLGPLVVGARHFGCATLYEVAPVRAPRAP